MFKISQCKFLSVETAQNFSLGLRDSVIVYVHIHCNMPSKILLLILAKYLNIFLNNKSLIYYNKPLWISSFTHFHMNNQLQTNVCLYLDISVSFSVVWVGYGGIVHAGSWGRSRDWPGSLHLAHPYTRSMFCLELWQKTWRSDGLCCFFCYTGKVKVIINSRNDEHNL